ncbi:MAG: AarF/ABC1/UbiB kinase family protein [Planctomycetes bacterium]|nr:AarF/ABC1/UbiB kinase family protein [Planctomycetota bacterium]
MALNPPTQIRNFVSNAILLDLSGVPLHRLPDLYTRALVDIINDGKYWKIAKKYGVAKTTFASNEMYRMREDLLKLERGAHPVRWLRNAGIIVANRASDVYGFSEAWGKTVKIIDEMKKGASEADAALEAHKTLFDYSLVPPSVQYLRNAPIGIPFLTFYYKALPRMLETAIVRPTKFLKYALIGPVLSAMIADEFDQMLTRELDYISEASSTARFAEAFRGDPGISIPDVFWDLCGPRVLTLQEMSGTNLDVLLANQHGLPEKIDRRLIARRLADCYLKQMFELGTFHADPHPGNILIEPPARISLIDFGQVGAITDEFMTELMVLAYACANNEMDVVVETFADADALGRDTDRRALSRSLQTLLHKYHGLPLKRVNVGTLFAECSDVLRRHDVVIPREMAVVIKAIGTVGTVTARLDPDLNLLELIKPRIKKAMGDRFSPRRLARFATLAGWDVLSIFRRAPGQIRAGLRRFAKGDWELHVRHENLDRLIGELDRSSNRLAFSIVIASIIVGSSVVISAGSELKVFGVEVRYFGLLGYLVAGVLGLGLSWAIFRSGRLH